MQNLFNDYSVFHYRFEFFKYIEHLSLFISTCVLQLSRRNIHYFALF